MTVNLTDVIAPSFYSLHHELRRNKYTSFWLKGGRGSTKSSFAAIEIILGIVGDPDANAVALRKYGNTVRESILETFLWAIDILDFSEYFDSTKAPAGITFKPTGQKIILSGLDDPRKLKSIRVKKGYFKYLWFEETEEFNGMEEVRSVEQSVMRGGKNFVEFITYNPPNDPDAWVNAESEVKNPKRLVHFSNYLDVPPHWLGEKFLEDALILKQVNPLAYEHEYMGYAVGRAEQIIFHGKWEEKEFETHSEEERFESRFYYGADWGFANDPTALVRCYVVQDGPFLDLYIDHECGGVGIDMDEIPKLFDMVPESRKWRINADCARPETISHVKQKGFNIVGCTKWTGSVEDGVETIKTFRKIYVHPRCKKTIEEFKKYSYKVDRLTKEVLPVIVDKWNHYMDALRYALEPLVQRKGKSILDFL